MNAHLLCECLNELADFLENCNTDYPVMLRDSSIYIKELEEELAEVKEDLKGAISSLNGG